jgi:pSer/pThr/pTyr-binding forkhead associated (FHA) protein
MPAATPRLVLQATNISLNVPPGKSELIVGREDEVSGHFPEVNLGPHGGEDGGVSRRHARLLSQGGQWLLEDLQAVNFTFVNKQKVVPNVRQPLNHGDELRFGRIAVMFYTQ